MEFLTAVYLTLIFISLYFTFLFLIIFIDTRKNLFKTERASPLPFISIIIPAYNEEKTIRGTLQRVRKLDYPKKKLEVIVVNDCSTDRTADIIKEFKWVKLISLKKNSGRAAIPFNIGLKKAKGEFIAAMDADAFPKEDCLRQMVGYFKDKEVGGVTSRILVHNQKNSLLERLQGFELRLIVFVRKILEHLNSVYATPGPLSMYRKKVLLELGGLDENNMTQDIEIAWRLLKNNYKVKMCLNAITYVTMPSNIKHWWRQRTRWSVGGLQTLLKYRGSILKKQHRGMLGFVLLFFIASIIISLAGLGIIAYGISKASISISLMIKNILFSGGGGGALKLYFIPSTLFIFGTLLISISVLFFFIGLSTVKSGLKPQNNYLSAFLYISVYYFLHPIVLVYSIYKLARGGGVNW